MGLRRRRYAVEILGTTYLGGYFRQVDWINRTLLFWASLLSGMQSPYRNPELRKLRQCFVDALKV